MARVECKCGEILSNHYVPNDVQLWVYTCGEWSSISENTAIVGWLFPSPSYDVWRCPTCERIYVYKLAEWTGKEWVGHSGLVKKYVLEDLQLTPPEECQTKCLSVNNTNKTSCSCDENTSISQSTNNIQLRVYTDVEWDALLTPKDEDHNIFDPNTFPLPTYDVWRCPICEKIYVFNWGVEKPIKIYIPED